MNVANSLFCYVFELAESVMGQMSGLLDLLLSWALLFPTLQCNLQPVFPQPKLCSPHHPHHILISLHHAAFYKEDEKIKVQSPWSANESRETEKPRKVSKATEPVSQPGYITTWVLRLPIQCPWKSIVDQTPDAEGPLQMLSDLTRFPVPSLPACKLPEGEANLPPVSKPSTMTRVHGCFLSGWTHIRSLQTKHILNPETNTLDKTANHISLNKMKGPSYCRHIFSISTQVLFPNMLCLTELLMLSLI